MCRRITNRTIAVRGEAWNRLKRVTQLQNLLIIVAVVFVVLSLYPFSLSSQSSPTALQYVGGFGLIVVGIAAVLLYYLRPSQKRPGEQVSY